MYVCPRLLGAWRHGIKACRFCSQTTEAVEGGASTMNKYAKSNTS